MVALNYVKETNEIIAELTKLNKNEKALKLADVLRFSSTGTELIMGIKFHLENLNEPDVPVVLQKKISNLVAEIEEILK